MSFSDVLKLYFDKSECTAKELSAASGVSASALSRYRSGKRIPDREQIEKLISGFVRLAGDNSSGIDEKMLRNAFSPYIEDPKLDCHIIIKNLNSAIELLDISVSGLSKALSFDSSYLSRIRAGQRKPADPARFVAKTAAYITRTKSPRAISELIGCSMDELVPSENCAARLCGWLSSGTVRQRDYLGELLHKLDSFDIADYLRETDLSDPLPARNTDLLSLPKTYYGFEEMKKGELDFFSTVIYSGYKGSVFMCNSIPIEDLSADAAYMREWMRCIAMMIMNGADIRIIHDVDRPSGEMLLGLMSWMPLYMTGKVSSYYLTDSSNRVYCHADYVSDNAALTGECIRGYHDEGKYCLSQNKTDIDYCKKRVKRLFSKTKPLMKTYRAADRDAFFRFEDSGILSGGKRRNILSSLPTYTIPDDVLESMLEKSSFEEKDRVAVREYIARQRAMAEKILENGTICDEICVPDEAEFEKEAVYLSLSGMFSEKDLRYTYRQYLRHLAATKQYAAEHSGYYLHTDDTRMFRNIQLRINTGKWVIVSKNNAPAIHFVIRHPAMIRAFEDLFSSASERNCFDSDNLNKRKC